MGTMAINIIKLIRPAQWVKNFFILFPLFFGGQLLNAANFINSAVAFVIFCFTASAVYCFNDIIDCEKDKLHPKKKNRPLAAGKISKTPAYCIALILLFFSSITAFLFFSGKILTNFLFIVAIYVIMNILYSLWLKKIAILDVIIVSLFYVIRIVVGGIVTGIVLSEWLVIMTFALALFLAFAKRRDDVVISLENGVSVRENTVNYNLNFLNQILSIIATIIIIGYVMYSISSSVTARFGNHFYITTLFVLMGVIRYLQITIVKNESGSPTKILLKDYFIQICILLWLITSGIMIYS